MKTPRKNSNQRRKSHVQKKPIDSFFRLGTIHVDSELLARLRACGMELADYIGRHASGDCGEICESVKSRNSHVLKNCITKELNIKRGYLVMSLYSLSTGERFYIATKSLGRGTVVAFDFQLKYKIGTLSVWAAKALSEALGKQAASK